jgi:hypothetical protein
LSLFFIIAGLVVVFAIVALLGMALLRRMLLPSPLRKSNLPPSGARPWQHARSMASLHGFASWHGVPASGPPQPQTTAHAAATLPMPTGAAFAPPPRLNQDASFSQAAAAWSQEHRGPAATAPTNQPQWMPPQQSAPQNNLSAQPQNGLSAQTQPMAWNSTPFVSQRRSPEGWEGHTFASWNRPPSSGTDNAPAKGNTGKFRRNSLLPFADVQQPDTNEVWSLGDQATGAQ